MKRALVIAVAAGAVVLVWAALYFPRSGSTDRAPAPAPAPVEVEQPAAAGVAAPPRVEQAPAAPGPAPAPPPAKPTPAPAAAPAPSPESAVSASAPALRPERMGPVDELRVAYERDARDAEAGELEQRIRGHLHAVEIPGEMLRGVSCVKSVCKLQLRWTPAHKEAYLIAMMNLVSHVSQKIAAEPVGEDEGQDVRPIDVYVSRIEPPYSPVEAN
jgi:hypothetical protein